MSTLVEIWLNDKGVFDSKRIDQILGFAGDGLLRDSNDTAKQLREFFASVPSDNLAKYIDDCINQSFPQSGLVLQDLVNELGKRLGFAVKSGFYRGGANIIGYDGIWTTKDGFSFVIEVKTTDAYQINLDTQATYRNRLINENLINQENSSILIVVGRKDTGGLEAQTRGSRHAWDVRIISVDALLKLIRVRENLLDDKTVLQIQEILKPLEYTKVDRLIDIIFKTSEDLIAEDPEDIPIEVSNEAIAQTQSSPVKFHEACINRVSSFLNANLIKQGRCSYENPEGNLKVLCLVSKEHEPSYFWYSFHPNQQEYLGSATKSFVALGCGSANNLALIPWNIFIDYLPTMKKTITPDRYYWHVKIFPRDGKYLLNSPTSAGINITQYFLK